MTRILFIALLLLCSLAHAEPPCKLKGRVKVVKSGATYRVKVVEHFPDVRVRKVKSLPTSAGEWQFVDSFPDFTVQLVDSFPDFTVQYVDSFPGCGK